MRSTIVTYILLLATTTLLAQEGISLKRVTFDYQGVRLKEALADLTDRYQIPFSYSTEQVNVRQRITAKVSASPLPDALDRLFENVGVGYMVVGTHIVLKNEPEKAKTKSTGSKQSTLKKRTPEVQPEQPAVLVRQEEPLPEAPPPLLYDSVVALHLPAVQPIRRQGDLHPFDETLLNFEKWRYQANTLVRHLPNEKRIAQVSVLPFIGTNTHESDDLRNHISVNLLWGFNGGVDGIEVGAGLNMIKHDVKGFQLAGLGNKVGRNMTGTQVGGIFNYAGGLTQGFQAAGVVNFAHDVQAAQVAGVANMVRGNLAGIQASGVFNLVAGNAHALQVASLFNKTDGDSKIQVAGAFNLTQGKAKVQLSGIFNVADKVEIGQVSLLFNRSRGEMKGLQLGLINISDTVSGVSIGLLNIVKRGYNKCEIYGSEILHGNFQLKIGANTFYNIFHVGARIPPGDGSYVWGVGYGVGTVTTLSEKSTLNWELMAIHLNENEEWTNVLNSIGQFRWLWNHQLGKSIGFFIGPTANALITRLRNADTGEIRSSVVPYALIDKDLDGKTSLKAWIGVNSGFRF